MGRAPRATCTKLVGRSKYMRRVNNKGILSPHHIVAIAVTMASQKACRRNISTSIYNKTVKKMLTHVCKIVQVLKSGQRCIVEDGSGLALTRIVEQGMHRS